MALKRKLIRAEFVESMSNTDQENFIDDYYGPMSNDQIVGVMVANGGWVWIDIEGEEADVDTHIDNILADSRIEWHNLMEQKYPGSATMNGLFGHVEGCAYRS